MRCAAFSYIDSCDLSLPTDLKLVRVRAKDAKDFRALAESASAHAAWWGRKRITARGLDESLISGTNITVQMGGDYRPGAGWLGDKLEAPLEWIYNQRFA